MSKSLEAVHARAVKRMDATWVVQKPERRESLDDRKFYTIRGAQWDDEWGTQFENAPRMEVDKTHKEVIRILSDYRNNRIAVNFRPDDETNDDETADNLDGLYRADFMEGGQEAQDNAFEESVGGGMGAWRLRACYEDEGDPDNDYQCIRWEPITDADQRVFFGPSLFQDKHDAKWCIVLNPIPEEEFLETYEGKAEVDFQHWPTSSFNWYQPHEKVVYLAEYYEVDEAKTQKVTLTHPVIKDEKVLYDPSGEELTDLGTQGWKIAKTRTATKPKVTKYVMSGAEVLSEEAIPGPNIPIMVTYGKRWVVENIERFMGHVRKAKDPQRIYNAQVSQLSEIAACSPIERPIFDPEQVDGNIAKQWAEANINRHPYALAKALRDEDGKIVAMGPIGKVSAPSVPQALAAAIQLSGQDIADIIGATDQNEEVPANTSAQAIELVHQRADAKTFIYIDNHSLAVKRGGEVWLGMCKELYIEKDRRMPTVDEQGNRNYIQLGRPGLAKDKSQIVTNDFANGKWKPIVDIGPSSQSRRDATVRSLVGMGEVAGKAGDQQLAAACINAALAQMDGEGIQDLKKWVRMRAIGMGVLQPTDEEKQEMAQQQANQQPDPGQALLAAKVEETQMSAEQKRSDAILKTAQANALGGPDKAPEVPTGLKAVHEAVQIRKTAAEADNLEANTAHMPTKLAIEATNAATNRIKAHKTGNPPSQ